MGIRVEKIGVIGSGNIGPDIAFHFAQNLKDTPIIVVDISEKALERGRGRITESVNKLVKRGKIKEEEGENILNNLHWTTDYSSLSGVNLVIEAATEDITIKHKIFSQLEQIVSDDTILASNSSHMEPEEIFAKVKNQQRTLVIHYFFPAHRNMMLEVVPSSHTDKKVVNFILQFYEELGKFPVEVKSSYGYAIDPIFEGLIQGAILMVERGVGTSKEVDAMIRDALKMGVGPFTAINLTGGNPITYHGLNEMHHKLMKWFKSPTLLETQLKTGKPWVVPQRGEEIKYDITTYQKVKEEVMGLYFGLVCTILDREIISLPYLNMAVEIALVMEPPFDLMNKIGIKTALELVENYHKKYPDFKVPESLKRQAQKNKPWKIPSVFREDRGEVAIVTICRPKVLNALNTQVINELEEIFKEIKTNSNIKAVVLTGKGGKAFVSGADITELAEIKTPEEGIRFARRGQQVFSFIENLGKPVVCAMNGLALGGGNELAMVCTIRIGKKGLKLFAGQPEPNLGIIPGYGGTQRLPRIIGMKKAWELLRTGRIISSKEAKEIGLIYEEIEGNIIDAGVELANKIINKEIEVKEIEKNKIEIPTDLPEVNIGHLSRKIDEIMKDTILQGAKLSLEEGLKCEAEGFGRCLLTKDMRIGMENFILYGAKRKAKFAHA